MTTEFVAPTSASSSRFDAVSPQERQLKDGGEALHPSAQAVADRLVAAGVAGPFLEFDAPTKTAADAARALRCDVGAIASCLVFVLDDEPIVILKSGAFRVDLERFTSLVGGRETRRATPDEVRAATGQPIGGVSPVNWPGALRVFIDSSLAQYEQVWAACGTPNAVFATSYHELARLTNATPVTLS
jgi:prolyl-tRNA editing enzyme YbaK/EbsC (Cys-tRNA(Pro) deacylase)